MNRGSAIANKRGCDRDSFNLILVKADVDSISKIFIEYFELKVYDRCSLKQYLELNDNAYREQDRLQSLFREKRRDKKRKKNKGKPRKIPINYPLPIWQYRNHNWSVVFLHGDNDSVAFAFSILLDTDVITFWESKYAVCSEYKLFRNDKLVEHYRFGSECGKLFNDRYWDLIIKCQDKTSLFPDLDAEEHQFCSSIRKVTAENITRDLDTKRDLLRDRGFLDSCLKHHDAYIPTDGEMPWDYGDRNSPHDLTIEQWNNSVERLDIIMRSNYWSYYDRNVAQVIKN